MMVKLMLKQEGLVMTQSHTYNDEQLISDMSKDMYF